MAGVIWSAVVLQASPKAVRRQKTSSLSSFPRWERLREWYASPEYAEALKLRATALDRRLIFVEGVPAV